MNKYQYPFTIRPLMQDEGSGYLIEYPTLPGCMSDGETIEQAIANGNDAVECWLAIAKEKGLKIPEPNTIESASGKWVQRVPKSIHAKLTYQAKLEDVSLNTLVLSYLAEQLGAHNKRNTKTAKFVSSKSSRSKNIRVALKNKISSTHKRAKPAVKIRKRTKTGTKKQTAV